MNDDNSHDKVYIKTSTWFVRKILDEMEIKEGKVRDELTVDIVCGVNTGNIDESGELMSERDSQLDDAVARVLFMQLIHHKFANESTLSTQMMFDFDNLDSELQFYIFDFFERGFSRWSEDNKEFIRDASNTKYMYSHTEDFGENGGKCLVVFEIESYVDSANYQKFKIINTHYIESIEELLVFIDNRP